MTPELCDGASWYEFRINVVPFGDPHLPSVFVDAIDVARAEARLMLQNPKVSDVLIYDTVGGIFYAVGGGIL